MTVDSEFDREPTHIFFGGTFDPPHEGHRLVINLCLRAFADAKVVVIPAAQPAGAFGQHKTVMTSFEDRRALCERAFAEEIEAGRVLIDPIEKDLPAPNYSWKTLSELEKQYPASRWAILFGFDQLQNLSGWKNAEQLVERYALVAIERPGFEEFAAIRPKLEASFGAIKALDERDYRMASGRKLYVIQGEVSPAESRLIRSSPHEASRQSWMKPDVLKYIREHRLYGE